jgi:Protein of unknown function (DUF3105)
LRRGLPLLLAAALLLGACGANSGASSDGGSDSGEGHPAPEGIEGVVAYDITDNSHAEGPVDYPMHPPVAGPHNHVWINCQFYDSEIPDENAVHSLEHGAVWIAYDPELPADEKAALQERVDGDGYLLASPYPGLDSPLVLTAWNRQLALDSMDDRRFEEFIDTYRLGPTSLEPGAACSGGAG